MVEFAYNNAKIASTGHTSFELNCRYCSYIFYEKNLNSRSKLRTAEELSSKLSELMIVCQQNLRYAQKLQKQAHNKEVKPQSNTLGNKV